MRGTEPTVHLFLPGERQSDSQLVERFLAEAQAIWARKSLEALVAVAEHLLDTFFAGSFHAYAERANDHLTFRELETRQEGSLSGSVLNRMLNIYAQLHEMEPIAWQLTPSHHRALLPVTSLEVKNELARRAVAEGLPTRAFEVLAQQEVKRQGGHRGAGRKARPPVLKRAGALRKVMEGMPALTSEPLLPEIDPDEQLRVAEELEAYGRQLTRTAWHIRNQLDTQRRR